ncbi:MAG: GxxExxY protein [Planctomycetes bacterium]|nr:GxxExxY protein [Planctomycetota bacterium]
MPIHCPQIRDLTQPEFDAVDKVVMRHAYACQNALGRLCNEGVYEHDLALRLCEEGHDVHTQVPITVSHRSFEKMYRLDLVCDHAVYDAKTVQAFVGEHDAQVLHYAMLLDIRHVKLLNFRTDRVQGRLRFNALTTDKRHRFRVDTREWRPLSDQCEPLRQYMENLLTDWGVFLDSRLYEDALVHSCGGEAQCVRRIDLARSGNLIGTHRVQQHSGGLFFTVSSVTSGVAAYQSHLQRLLQLTGLRGLQWINLCHHDIQFVTLT